MQFALDGIERRLICDPSARVKTCVEWAFTPSLRSVADGTTE